jgi:hypothetical protein
MHFSLTNRSEKINIPELWRSTVPNRHGVLRHGAQGLTWTGNSADLNVDLLPTSLSRASHDATKQSWWADRVNTVRRARLETSAPIRDVARLRCQSKPLANAWMGVMPAHTLGTAVSNEDYSAILRFMLGVPLVPGLGSTPCPGSHEAVDIFGDQFLCCGKNGMSEFDNAVLDALF